MVSVSEKIVTKRIAVASGRVFVGKHIYDLIKSNSLKKGKRYRFLLFIISLKKKKMSLFFFQLILFFIFAFLS